LEREKQGFQSKYNDKDRELSSERNVSSGRRSVIQKQDEVFKKMEDKLKDHQPPEKPFNLSLLSQK
jgi:hypothetical protein